MLNAVWMADAIVLGSKYLAVSIVSTYSDKHRSVSHNMCLNLTFWLHEFLSRSRHCMIHLHIKKKKNPTSERSKLRRALKGILKENHKIKWA